MSCTLNAALRLPDHFFCIRYLGEFFVFGRGYSSTMLIKPFLAILFRALFPPNYIGSNLCNEVTRMARVVYVCVCMNERRRGSRLPFDAKTTPSIIWCNLLLWTIFALRFAFGQCSRVRCTEFIHPRSEPLAGRALPAASPLVAFVCLFPSFFHCYHRRFVSKLCCWRCCFSCICCPLCTSP